MKVTAKATRTGDRWTVEVPEVPGAFTQAKRLDQVEEMVADAVSLIADVPVDAVEVKIDPVFKESAVVAKALRARKEADAAAAVASARMREAARALLAAGLTVRDAGVALRISPQRVSQLAGGVKRKIATS